jgi:hypothetical protein
MNSNLLCRKSQAELDRDVAYRLDEEQGLADTSEQMVKDRVIELMDADSDDEDSIVVLMESDSFVNALRKLMSNRHTDKRCHEELLEDSVNLVSVAESVLSEYVELGL